MYSISNALLIHASFLQGIVIQFRIYTAMLITQKDINDAQAPFILENPTGDWKLVVNILRTENQFTVEVVDSNQSELSIRTIELEDVPFYVGADIWELEYGTRLIKLDRKSEPLHPAYKLWKKWLKKINN